MSLFDFKNPINIPGNIEQNYFVLAVGIDKANDGVNKFKLTAIGEKFNATSGDTSSTSGKSAEIVTVDGNTMFETVRNFALFKSKSVFWGHIKYILISEEVAKENILDILDFFIRDHELRFDTTIVIVKDTSAESFIRSGEQIKQFTVDLLDGVFHNIGKLSLTYEIRLSDVMQTFNNVYCSAYIPAISMVSRKNDEISTSKVGNSTVPIGGGKPVGTTLAEENILKEEINSESDSKSKEEDSSKSDSSSNQGDNLQSSGSTPKDSTSTKEKDILYLNLNGFAVFDGVKLLGYVSDYMARGLNWINSNIVSTIIVVKDEKEKDVSMEVINSSSKIKIDLDGNIPQASININFSTNIGEVMSQDNIFNEVELSKIIEKQNDIVKKEAESIIEFAQKNNLDILGISDAIYHQHPLKWDIIKENWKETFKTMEITVNVQSNVNRTYHIRQPIRSESGDK
ncbi:MAG: gerKC4 [Clostridia bacterium]|nr:gerKC4 [Clostridia bacterium]